MVVHTVADTVSYSSGGRRGWRIDTHCGTRIDHKQMLGADVLKALQFEHPFYAKLPVCPWCLPKESRWRVRVNDVETLHVPAQIHEHPEGNFLRMRCGVVVPTDGCRRTMAHHEDVPAGTCIACVPASMLGRSDRWWRDLWTRHRRIEAIVEATTLHEDDVRERLQRMDVRMVGRPPTTSVWAEVPEELARVGGRGQLLLFDEAWSQAGV